MSEIIEYEYPFFENDMGLCKEAICNCENCDAVCCKVFNVPLTPNEIKTHKYDDAAFRDGIAYLAKNGRGGCYYLTEDNKCKIWETRPITCREYTCEGDPRIKKVEL